jgi:Ca-activated chloride channel family protein
MSLRNTRIRWIASTVVITAVAVPLLLRQDGRSLEHGNRLYHDGDSEGAASVYAPAVARGSDGALYNLGTALLDLDFDSADVVLSDAIAASDPATAQRSFYNLGYALLVTGQIPRPITPDSAAAILQRAVDNGRIALRMDPADDDARWNLALAQRALDAMQPPGSNRGRESSGESDDEIPMNDPSMARSETAEAESGAEPDDPREADSSGPRQGPLEGAREAWAAQDPGPMTQSDAASLLLTVSDETEALVRGLLWAHRPDVAWWSGQAYPGGPW